MAQADLVITLGRTLDYQLGFGSPAGFSEVRFVRMADRGGQVSGTARTDLDAGAFGYLGIGVPFAIAAALAHPDRQVIAVTGDGA